MQSPFIGLDNNAAPFTEPQTADSASLVAEAVTMGWSAARTVGYRLYFPEPYEPRYAYPLIVVLREEGDPGSELSRWFPSVSAQNFLAVAVDLPGSNPSAVAERYGWAEQSLRVAQRLVEEAVESVSALWKVNHQRIYMMGAGRLAELAIRLAWESPTQAGAIALAPVKMPTLPPPPRTGRRLPKRVLLIPSTGETVSREGLDLTELGAECSPTDQGRAINRWLMLSNPRTVW